MAEMKGIKLCGECGNYDWKRHKCKIGCNDDSNAQSSFYGDCPLPDVVPKSEVERLTNILDSYALQYGTVMDKHIVIEKARQDGAREIFEEINSLVGEYEMGDIEYPDFCFRLGKIEKKYT